MSSVVCIPTACSLWAGHVPADSAKLPASPSALFQADATHLCSKPGQQSARARGENRTVCVIEGLREVCLAKSAVQENHRRRYPRSGSRTHLRWDFVISHSREKHGGHVLVSPRPSQCPEAAGARRPGHCCLELIPVQEPGAHGAAASHGSSANTSLEISLASSSSPEEGARCACEETLIALLAFTSMSSKRKICSASSMCLVRMGWSPAPPRKPAAPQRSLVRTLCKASAHGWPTSWQAAWTLSSKRKFWLADGAKGALPTAFKAGFTSATGVDGPGCRVAGATVRACSHRDCSPKRVSEVAGQMLGHRLVTKQTGAQGKPCNRCSLSYYSRTAQSFILCSVLVARRLFLRREAYFAILLDRESSGPVLVGRSNPTAWMPSDPNTAPRVAWTSRRWRHRRRTSSSGCMQPNTGCR